MDAPALLLLGALALTPGAQTSTDPFASGGPAQEARQDQSRRFRDGITRLSVGDLESARTILQAALDEDPKNLEASLFLAEVLHQEDPTNLEPVEKALRTLQRQHPEAPQPLLRQAVLLRDAGALDRAEALLHEGLETFPDHPKFLHLLGTVRIARGEQDAGFRLLQQAASASPGDPFIRRDLGVALLDKGFPGQALKTLSALKERLPQDPELRRALADLYRGLNDPARAVEETRFAEFYEASEQRAKLRTENRRALSRRIDALEKEADAGARPGVFAELWELYNWRGDMSWNLVRMEHLARKHPESIDAQAALGRTLMVRGAAREGADAKERAATAAEAERILQAVLDKQPDHDLALEGLLLLHGRRQEASQAIALGKRAVKANTGNAVAHVHLGRAKLVANDPEGAIAAFRRALELDPGNLDALLNLANVLRRSGKARAARPLLSSALVAAPEVPRVLMSLGQAAFQDGNDEAAWKFLTQAEDLGARHANLFTTLATLHARRGFLDAAATYQRMARGAQRGQ